jgi:hypothetical protein
MARGGLTRRPKLKPKMPPSISLLRIKNGLDNGVHFITAEPGHVAQCVHGLPFRGDFLDFFKQASAPLTTAGG